MSISEISAASALPERSSARIKATAARALGPGAVRIDTSSSSVRPLITGTPGTTARRSSPSTRPSSSIQCSRAACTSVKGRRSSTTIVTRLGSSRTMSARRRGESRPLLTEDADLGLEGDPEVAVDALARELHETQDVGGAGGAAVDDEVGVLGRDLRAIDALAAQPGLLDEPRGQLAGGIFPDEAGGGQRQRLRGLLLLEPCPDLLLDLRQRPAVELQPAADEHRARRQAKRAIAELARGLELAERAVGVEVVDGAHEVADPAVGGARVHRQRAADGGRDADEALDAAEVEGGRLADERGETHARARQRLLAVVFGAAETALELEHHAANTAVAHHEVVAAADDGHRQLLALGEHQRMPDDLDVLRDDEDVGGTADAQRGVEAQRFFE